MAYSNEERTQMLLQAQKQVLSGLKEKIATRHIHGEVIEIEWKGQKSRMLHYSSENPDAPVYFDIHGGGFVWGMMEEGDLFCHHINEQLGFEVYALDYPLGPLVRYPVALEYLYDLIKYMRENAFHYGFDPQKMVVGGRSAGGNLAAALCLLAKEKGEFQFACQILDHPYLDLCNRIDDSKRYSAEGVLAPELMHELAAAYADDKEREEIYCSPINASIRELEELPPAIIQTCEYDSLRIDGDLYAQMLDEAGVELIHHCFPKVMHGFTELEGEYELAGQNWLIDHLKMVLSESSCRE